MQILNYNRTEFSALFFPFNMQCVKATSWSKLKSFFILFHSMHIYNDCSRSDHSKSSFLLPNAH